MFKLNTLKGVAGEATIRHPLKDCFFASVLSAAEIAAAITYPGILSAAAAAAAAGAIDIGYRVYKCEPHTFFRPMNHVSQARDKLVTVLASPFVAAYFVLEHTLVLFTLLLKSILHFITCNTQEGAEALSQAYIESREALVNFAGILLFPLLNLVDLFGSSVASMCREVDSVNRGHELF
ncbi:MAG: hypothetical protein H0U75_12540 [Legionella sp.]|nr:hypothetical protein [Legionella sp.]